MNKNQELNKEIKTQILKEFLNLLYSHGETIKMFELKNFALESEQQKEVNLNDSNSLITYDYVIYILLVIKLIDLCKILNFSGKFIFSGEDLDQVKNNLDFIQKLLYKRDYRVKSIKEALSDINDKSSLDPPPNTN